MNDGLEKRGISSVFGDELSPFRYDTIYRSFTTFDYIKVLHVVKSTTGSVVAVQEWRHISGG